MNTDPVVFNAEDSSVEIPGWGWITPSFVIDPGVEYIEVCSSSSDRCFVLKRGNPHIRDLVVPGHVSMCFFSDDGNVAFLYTFAGFLYGIAVRSITSSWRVYELPLDVFRPSQDNVSLRIAFSSMEDLRRFLEELKRLEKEDPGYARVSKLVSSVSVFTGRARRKTRRKSGRAETADQEV